MMALPTLRIGYNSPISRGDLADVVRLLRFLQTTSTLLGVVCCVGCSAITSSLTSGMSDSLATSILNQNDPQTVRDGAPAYLLMIDGFVTDDPDNVGVLLAAARLNSSYAGAFVDDPARRSLMALKARNLAWKAMCLTEKKTCGVWTQPYEEFAAVIDTINKPSVPAMYTAASAWAGWIQANRADWVAIADKARVEKMIQRIVALEPDYQDGEPYLYLGVLATLIPEALGGKPEEGRAFFERSIELSGGKNLLAKVLLARDYARAKFDKELHDRLCTEVVEADPNVEGMVLSNTLAQREAQALLDDSQEYFGD